MMREIIQETIARHWCKERGVSPDKWCVYTAGKPPQCIETFLQWRMKEAQGLADAITKALEERGY